MVNCGRYIKGHAKDHFEQHSNHTVCMQCTNLAVYWLVLLLLLLLLLLLNRGCN